MVAGLQPIDALLIAREGEIRMKIFRNLVLGSSTERFMKAVMNAPQTMPDSRKGLSSVPNQGWSYPILSPAQPTV